MKVHRVELREIESMRDMYRHEMNCQIIHDSIHARPGWSHEYLITEGDAKVGYGSVAVAGPWKAKPTVYEYFLLPQHRGRIFDSFIALLTSSGATCEMVRSTVAMTPLRPMKPSACRLLRNVAVASDARIFSVRIKSLSVKGAR